MEPDNKLEKRTEKRKGGWDMKKKIFAILLVLWMGFIFSMSSQNSTVSSNTSGGTIRMIMSTVPKFDEQSEEVQDEIVESLQYITRKSAHFIGYMILGILAILLFLQYENIKYKGWSAFLLSVLYAISDEVHQLFVPGRSGQVKDVLIDSCGAALGIVIVILVCKAIDIYRAKVNKDKLTK